MKRRVNRCVSIPVSYTHLDVYKRQAERRVTRELLGLKIRMRQHRIAEIGPNDRLVELKKEEEAHNASDTQSICQTVKVDGLYFLTNCCGITMYTTAAYTMSLPVPHFEQF